MKKLKGIFCLVTILAFFIVAIVPAKVYAGKPNIIVAYNKTSTENEEQASGVNITEYINGKKQSFVQSLKAIETNEECAYDFSGYDDLFCTTAGSYKYAVYNGSTDGENNSLTVNYTEVNVSIADDGFIGGNVGEGEKISTIAITVNSPKIGTTITETTEPSVTFGANSHFTVGFSMYTNCLPSEGVYDDGAIFGTVIEEGKTYCLEVFLEPDEGYQFADSDNVALTVNGAEAYELGWCSGSQFAIYAKVKATNQSDDNKKDEENTYEVIKGKEQEFNKKSGEALEFQIAADYSLFEDGGKVFVDGDEVDNKFYKSKAGSTIITFEDEYVDTLSNGEHTLKVAFNNGEEVTTTFTILEESESDEASKSVKAGDNLGMFVMIAVIAVMGSVIVKIGKK